MSRRRTIPGLLASNPHRPGVLLRRYDTTVEAHKERMLAEVRAYRLRELREEAGLTQQQLADRIGVSQRQVSKIEHGDLDHAKVGTIRRYLEAVGGGLSLEYVTGDARVQVA